MASASPPPTPVGASPRRARTTEGRDEKIAKPERLHGRHVLNRYEDGMEKCIGCELCAGVCPAKCIHVRGADNDPQNPTSPGERFGFVYEINYLRCIHCDLCVEACPTEAITESKLFEFSFTSRKDAVYTKAELLVGDDGKPKQLPWEDWREGEDLLTSGWMRATAASGDADFVGEVGWSGELGYGVRAPSQAGAGRHAQDREVGDPLMELFVFIVAGAMVLGGAVGVIVSQAPGARRAQPHPHAVRRGGAVRRAGGQLPRGRAGHRLRRRHRRAVPVRHHAARRRQRREPAHRAVQASSGRWPPCVGAGVFGLVVGRHHRVARRRHGGDGQPGSRSPAPTARRRTTATSRRSPATCSATTCWPSSSPRCCSSSPSSAP